jgi:RNA polymerase sigma-70 factor (ECF subfamily)
VSRVLPSERLLDPDRLGDYLDRLYRAAWALCGGREEAEDLVQETYVRVLARPRFLRSDDDLGYLLRVLRNTFISQRRRPTPPVTDVGDDQLERLPDPAAGAPQDVLEAHLVYGAIAQLPSDFREAIVWVDVAGLSYREAARALRVREGTLTSRLFRARRQVAQALGAGDVKPRRSSPSSAREEGVT